MDAGAAMTILILAAATAALLLLWLSEDNAAAPAMTAESLRPTSGKAGGDDMPIAVARTILEHFLSEMIRLRGEDTVAAHSPMRIKSATIPNWLGGSVPLAHPVENWTIAYQGGGRGTATSADGVRTLLNARRRKKRGNEILLMVTVEDDARHLIKCPAVTKLCTTHYRRRGWGRFSRIEAAAQPGRSTKTMYRYLYHLDTNE